MGPASSPLKLNFVMKKMTLFQVIILGDSICLLAVLFLDFLEPDPEWGRAEHFLCFRTPLKV